MNINQHSQSEQICQLLKAIDQPARLNILLTIGSGEACVCHLESVLGLRQAYISQHLMGLREAGILTTRREGRYIFYSLKDVRLLELIQLASEMAGVQITALPASEEISPAANCCCPHCETQTIEITKISEV